MNAVLFALIDAWLLQEVNLARWDRNYARALVGRGAGDEAEAFKVRVAALSWWRSLWPMDASGGVSP